MRAKKKWQRNIKKFLFATSRETLIRYKLKIAPSTIITIITEILEREKIIHLVMDAPDGKVKNAMMEFNQECRRRKSFLMRKMRKIKILLENLRDYGVFSH